MSYFILMGSPRSRQVRGPHRLDHHAGWLDIDTFSWGGANPVPSAAPGKTKFTKVAFSRPADLLSTQLFLHCHAGEGFDLVLLDVWDDRGQRSKVKFEFLDVMISSCQQTGDSASFTLDFADLSMIPGSGAKADVINPVIFKMAMAGAAPA